jgi:lambda repressor-like predicted transcriptional regulator
MSLVKSLRDQDKTPAGISAGTVGDEHRNLVARLEAISTDLGSRAALAKRAGIAPSSLQNYFDHSEPTRPVLIALARAAHVSITWLATGSSPKRADNMPEDYFGVAYYDLRPYGDRIHPLLDQPSEFRILHKADLDERLINSETLQAMQTNEGLPPYIANGDLFIIDTAIHVGPVVAGGRFPKTHCDLEESAIYAIAYQVRLSLRQLRWKEIGKIMTVLAPGSKKAELTVTEETLDFRVIGKVVWRGGAQPA